MLTKPLLPAARDLSSTMMTACLLSALLGLMTSACGGPEDEMPLRDAPAGTQHDVEEPIAFTSTPYASNLDGPTSIAELKKVIPALNVWHGYADDSPFPVQGDCDPNPRYDTVVASTPALPVTIQGVVTVYPRYYVKTSICGEDERFYGGFFVQDSTGGILVLRDSRNALFTFGDRVKLRVKGMTKYFDLTAVIAFDELEIVTGEERAPIYYEAIDRYFSNTDQGKVVQVVGKVSSEPNKNNFNELKLESLDGQKSWIVSVDREVGQRNPDWKKGDVLQVTGPVLNSFGLKIIVNSLGQVQELTP